MVEAPRPFWVLREGASPRLSPGCFPAAHPSVRALPQQRLQLRFLLEADTE